MAFLTLSLEFINVSPKKYEVYFPITAEAIAPNSIPVPNDALARSNLLITIQPDNDAIRADNIKLVTFTLLVFTPIALATSLFPPVTNTQFP